MKTQETTTVKETQQLESEGSTFMKPPAFALTAGEDGGGGGGEKAVPNHSGFQGTPYESEIASWPGEVVMIHSPCYSQEIEAIALNASFHPEIYDEAATAMDAKIAECLNRKFQNASGEVNDWADRKLHSTVKMNQQNMAATSNGKSTWPKLVILTFWNDPSNPDKGGYNYSHIVYFPIASLIPKEIREFLPGGTVFIGDGGGRTNKPDLSHDAKHVDYNEWLPIINDLMGKLAGMKGDPKSLSKDLPAWTQRLQKAAEDAEKIMAKVREGGKAVEENSAEKEASSKEEAEKYVEIDGQKFERDKEYRFFFNDNGQRSQAVVTPGYFQRTILSRKGVQYAGDFESLR